MPWYAYTIVALLALGSALNILAIGKERKPQEPLGALLVTIVNGLICWGVIELAT